MINWIQVKSSVEAAIKELSWNADISIDEANSRVWISIPEEQIDLIGETTFDFFKAVANTIDGFNNVEFYFEIKEVIEDDS